MPYRVSTIDVDRTVGNVQVAGRLTVSGPFYGGSSGQDEDTRTTYLARSLAERLERAITTAILNFQSDMHGSI